MRLRLLLKRLTLEMIFEAALGPYNVEVAGGKQPEQG